MLIAQFGSTAAQGWKPAWLANMVGQRDGTGVRAKQATVAAPWGDFGVDGYGAWRAPLDFGRVEVEGQVFCNERITAYEWERTVRAQVGVKDWLIGYMGAGCRCGRCGPYVRCCQSCGTEQQIKWFAKKVRLEDVFVTGNPAMQSLAMDTTIPVKMSFVSFSGWQAMSTTRWAWGVPEALATLPTETCNPPSVDEYAWPCEFPPCTVMPPYRFYRRAFTWQQNYCVGYWSAGRWIRASIGSEAIIQVGGDTYPLSRLAFTNFSELTLTVCSPTGFDYTFTIGDRYDPDKWVGEPQYLLISPWTPPQVRFCPVHDDECLDLVPGSYAAIAQAGAVVEVESQTIPILGYLWPGRNILEFSGFRLPGHPFHYSYDITPQFL